MWRAVTGQANTRSKNISYFSNIHKFNMFDRNKNLTLEGKNDLHTAEVIATKSSKGILTILVFTDRIPCLYRHSVSR